MATVRRRLPTRRHVSVFKGRLADTVYVHILARCGPWRFPTYKKPHWDDTTLGGQEARGTTHHRAGHEERGAGSRAPLLIGQARPPHPRFSITTGPGWGYGGACTWYCHLPQRGQLLEVDICG